MIIRHFTRPAARERRGAALIIALFVVLMISVLSMSYLQMSLNKNKEQQGAADAKRAFYLAEAGMAESYAGLLAGQSGNVANDIMPARFGAGVFWVKVEDLGNANLCLTSTGLCGTGRACISIVVRNESQSIASQGLLGDQGIAINVGSVVDSYDSRLGSYELQQLVVEPVIGHGGVAEMVLEGLAPGVVAPPGTRVTSNGNIVLQGTTARGEGAKIVGDALPGPNGIVTRGTGATVTGSMTPSTTAVALPEVPIPPIELGRAIVQDNAGRPLNVPTGFIGFESLRVTAGAEVIVHGPTTLVVDDLILEPGTKLTIDTTTGPVKIFVRDWLRCDPGSTIVSTNPLPTACSIMCAGSEVVDRDGDGIDDPPVTLSSTSEYYGQVYAPHASFTLPNSFHVFGALAAQSLVIAGGGRVHFDRAFLDSDANQMAAPRELCWRMIQLPPSKIVEQRLDPLRYLAAQGLIPVASKDAHYARGAAVPTAITKVWNRVTALGL